MELRRFLPGWRISGLALAVALALRAGVPAAWSNIGDGSEPLDDATPSTLTLVASGTEVAMAGDFDDGVASRLGALLDEHPDIRRIRLTSDGGLVGEAEAVGLLVSARGLVTLVTEYCLSACTLAFAHGQERLLARGAKLGFHAPCESDESGQDVAVNSDAEKRAYVATGIDAGFVDEALRVPFTDIWFPETARLLEARIVTALVEPDTGLR